MLRTCPIFLLLESQLICNSSVIVLDYFVKQAVHLVRQFRECSPATWICIFHTRYNKNVIHKTYVRRRYILWDSSCHLLILPKLLIVTSMILTYLFPSCGKDGVVSVMEFLDTGSNNTLLSIYKISTQLVLSIYPRESHSESMKLTLEAGSKQIVTEPLAAKVICNLLFVKRQ